LGLSLLPRGHLDQKFTSAPFGAKPDLSGVALVASLHLAHGWTSDAMAQGQDQPTRSLGRQVHHIEEAVPGIEPGNRWEIRPSEGEVVRSDKPEFGPGIKERVAFAGTAEQADGARKVMAAAGVHVRTCRRPRKTPYRGSAPAMEDLAAIMHHMAHFLTLGWRSRAGDPTV
jgi:hypothetical protein